MAAAIAILRYRLYDIDVVINRTLVYGALTRRWPAAYLGSVLLLQLVLSGCGGSGLAVAASTLAVAALFRPGARPHPGRGRPPLLPPQVRRAAHAGGVLGAAARRGRPRARSSAELSAVVAETMQPAHVSLWLRAPEARA